MGSQFVDLNADGHLDYLSATFDGSPHASWGGADGFAEPARIEDAAGERLLVSYYWDYDEDAHLTTGRSMPDGKPRNLRGISAVAMDWDGDGDLDLLQGSYEKGHLYLQLNEGSPSEPRFTGKNVRVMAGGVPLEDEAKMTAPRLVDWDADGDLDLVYGTFGGADGGAGIYLLVNQGKGGATSFAAPRTLLRVHGESLPTSPTGPAEGLYPEVIDWDKDGDLDLIVGGYSRWRAEAPTLNDEETAELARLRAAHEAAEAAADEVSKAFNKKFNAEEAKAKTEEEKEAAFNRVYGEFVDRLDATRKACRELQQKIDVFDPPTKRTPAVWFFERA
ncbi:MAG: VCBS repeat-containing protein [Planctomycetes bacterium]|nr:VCBS repeat-containing protein [Planctomycetota bacterium]